MLPYYVTYMTEFNDYILYNNDKSHIKKINPPLILMSNNNNISTLNI